MDNIEILKVIIGSRAYDLHTEDSDTDFRSVYIIPTSRLLSVDMVRKYSVHKQTNGRDDVEYEIGHFIHLALQSNPTILEIFTAPIVSCPTINGWDTIKTIGEELRELFPFVWSSKKVYAAFKGYATSQRRQAEVIRLSKQRIRKCYMAYIKTLIFGTSLLKDGCFPLPLPQDVKTLLLDIKNGVVSPYEYPKLSFKYEEALDDTYKKAPLKVANIEVINEFLLGVRKALWE